MTSTRRRSNPALDPSEQAWSALARAFGADPRVTLPAGDRGQFGQNGLRVDGKVFAMTVKGALVVKLPAREIDDAVASGLGERLSMGRRVMKEWLVVHEPPKRWLMIATRARAFVAGDQPAVRRTSASSRRE
ncbi:MAG: hypothetical protein JNM69_03905 [Archangium sp.]|nr:hypothetical protein [Archangium sp.]